MRIHKPLSKILNSSLKVDILRLFCRTNKQMTGREIARELNATAPYTHLALKELDSEGVLIRRVIGRAHIYSLNNSPWITDQILRPLFKEEGRLPDELMEAVKHRIKESKVKEEILSVAVFGSIYREQEKPNSDVDLLIVIKDGRSKNIIEDLIFDLDRELFPKVGLSLEPHIYSLTEFKEKYNDPKVQLIREVMKSHRIFYGQKLEVLI